MSRSDIVRAALENANVQAFLKVIRRGESNLTDDAYTLLYGGGHFRGFDDHPRQMFQVGDGRITSAAGAYQIVKTTWDALIKQYPDDLTDFTPARQDFAAVALILGRKALDDVIAGRVEKAIAKLRPEWTSLPGAMESQRGWGMDDAITLYAEQGGALVIVDSLPVSEPLPPVSPPVKPPPPAPPEKPMPIFLSALLQLIPGLITVFGKGDRAKENAKTFEVVADAVVKAVPGATDLPTAIGAMVADPTIKATVEQQVMDSPQVRALIEIGGGTVAARETDQKATQAEKGFWYSPVFWITLLMLPLVYGTVYIVLTGDGFSEEIKTVVVTAIVSGVLSSITGYFLGSALGSAQKQTTIDNQLRK